jgi:transglutaminase-like putative cysteine protease
MGGGKIRRNFILAMLLLMAIAFLNIGGTYGHENNNQILNTSNSNVNLITENTNNNASSDSTNANPTLSNTVSNIETTDTPTYTNSDNVDSSTEDSADSTQSSTSAAGVNDYTNVHGIWVTSAYALKLNVNTLLKMGITDIFVKCNIYSDPKYKTILPNVVKMFKNSGIRVNAWIICFKDANGKYINPKNTKHNNQLIAAIADITKKYGVDGINLDYVRYPGTAYKYSGSTAAITSFVHKVYDKVKGIKAKVAVSADLMPEGSVNAHYYGQDYNQLSKYLDYMVPMIYKGNYRKNTAWIGTTTKYIVKKANGKPVIVGLQTYKSDSNLAKLSSSELMQDIKAATDNGASGYVLFRYGLINSKFSDTSSSSTAAAGSSSTTKAVSSSTKTTTTTSQSTSQSLPTSFNQYLLSTKNCQMSNAQIKALAASLTKGKTSTYAKAVAIYNYVRDKIGYSFYYNTKYGAVGTLNKKTANCCDTAHLLIALERAAGIPARYVHVKAKFTSGVLGHVYAQVYVNGKWYTADGTSSRNSFGVVKNWSSATLKGIYASLPF